jgi:hypothetical protein
MQKGYMEVAINGPLTFLHSNGTYFVCNCDEGDVFAHLGQLRYPSALPDPPRCRIRQPHHSPTLSMACVTIRA